MTPVPLYETLRDRIRAEQPVALATILDGPNVGAKLLVSPDEEARGSLGHPELDRVVARDALAELEAGRTGVRHYGPEGQNNPDDPAIESGQHLRGELGAAAADAHLRRRGLHGRAGQGGQGARATG